MQPSRKRFPISACFGLFAVAATVLFTILNFGAVPAKSSWAEKYLFEFSSCKAEINVLRNELKVLNSTVATKAELLGSNISCEIDAINQRQAMNIVSFCGNKTKKILPNRTTDNIVTNSQFQIYDASNLGNQVQNISEPQNDSFKVNVLISVYMFSVLIEFYHNFFSYLSHRYYFLVTGQLLANYGAGARYFKIRIHATHRRNDQLVTSYQR